MPELQIVGAVDFAHAPFADQRDDAIAVGDLRSRQKPPVLRTVGRRGVIAAVVGNGVGSAYHGRREFRTQRSPSLRAKLARIGLFRRARVACDHKRHILT